MLKLELTIVEVAIMNSKPIAFVIMPFEQEFESVYVGFIEPVLRSSGYDVKRADDIENQRNIIRDIVESIYSSSLIVADLTGTNPNVFYELGLAHAFERQVILITQSIDDVPFDLQSQRLLEYSVRFDKINQARETLGKYARGALDGTVMFGSPVTDFIPVEVNIEDGFESSEHSEGDADELGFLDHFIAINDGYKSIAEIAEGVGGDLTDLTTFTNQASKDLNRLGDNPSDSSLAAARKICRKLATKVSNFTSKLIAANGEYSGIARNTDNSLEFVVSFQRTHSQASNPNVTEQLESLRSLQSVVTRGRDSLISLATTMGKLPRIERRLIREVARASEEVRTMASNLERTNASIERALRVQA